MLVSALLAATAALSDSEAPRVVHEPVLVAPRETELVIRADIRDPSGVFAAMVFFRPVSGEGPWQSAELRPLGEPDRYVAIIAASHVSADLDYYIEAFDTQGNGPAMVGSASAPLRVKSIDKRPEQVLVLEKAANPVRLAPLFVAGGGVILTAVGAALWFTSKARVDELDSRYSIAGEGRLPDDAAATRDAQKRSFAGSALMIGGAAAMTTGAVWFLMPTSEGGVSAGVLGSF